MTTKFKLIDIPAARAAIEAAIVECQIKSGVAEAVRDFLENHWPATPDRRIEKKLSQHLHDAGATPHRYVNFIKEDRWASTVRYSIRVGGMDALPQPEMSFGSITVWEDGKPDVAAAMLGNHRWGEDARALAEKLKDFDVIAGEFNGALKRMKGLCNYATRPGDSYPLWPLSNIFYWYELHD